MSSNGFESDAPLTERMIAVLARLRATVDGFSDSLRLLSEQQADGFEAVRKELRDEVRALERVILGIGHDVEEVRRDQTDPRMRLPNPAEVQPPYRNGKDTSDGALVATARLVEKVPAPLRSTLLKLALSGGLGAAIARAWLYLKTGH